MGLWLSGGCRIIGNFPIVGTEPTFDTNGGTASGQYNYFVQPIGSSLGGSAGTWYGPVWFIGRGQPPNGTDSITLEWPSIELIDAFYNQSIGNLTWNVYSTTGNTTAAPYGNGNFLVASGITGSCGTNGMCSTVDTQAARGNITIPAQTLIPHAWFWPADIATNGTIVSDTVYGHIVGSQGVNVSSPVQISPTCQGGGVSSERSPGVVSCLTSNNINQATLLLNTNGQATGSKGRVNFGPNQNCPNDWFTLYDSNFFKTTATAGERPLADAGDSGIGCGASGDISQHAANSISNVIGALPTGSNAQEQLTASGKTFTVPVTLPTLNTSTHCAAAGTSANPSVASCSAAPAGFFSCATAASTGTCTVQTTAVTANSTIHVQADASVTISGVTCNTTADSGLTAPRIASKVAGTSFTINLGTFTGNPECYSYFFVD
jgi:hypothetical protein